MVMLFKTYLLFSVVLKRVLAVVELLLGVRVLLKYFGANMSAFAVNILYSSTDVLVWPFQFIFSDYSFPNGKILEIDTLVAMVSYILAVALILWLLRVSYR